MTATKYAPSKVPDEPPMPVVNISEHELDMKRRQAEIDAARPELMKCLNPAVARLREFSKPVYRWTVSATWMSANADERANLQSEQIVTAQSEADAWSAFCDRIGHWPSRRDARPVFKKGKQLSDEAVAASQMADIEVDEEIPTIVVGPIHKSKKM